MEKPFKFRRVNEIAGAFVVVLVLLLASGIIVSGRIRGWFEPHRRYEVVLPEGGASGIREGSEVHILGSWAGAISRVDLRRRGGEEWIKDISKVSPNEIELVAVMELRSDLVAFVGTESKAILKHDLGGFGAPYIEITRGSSPRDPEHKMLALETTSDVQDELNSMVKEIRDVSVPAIKEIGAVAESLANPKGDFQMAIAGVNQMLTQINEGEAPISVLLNEKEAGTQLRDIMNSATASTKLLEESMKSTQKLLSQVEAGEGAIGSLFMDVKLNEDLNVTVANLRKTSTELSSAIEAINKSANEFPDTLNRTDVAIDEYAEAARIMQQALSEYELLALALQRHWLVRGAVKKEEASQAQQGGGTASAPTPRPVPQPDAEAGAREKKGIFSRILPGGSGAAKQEREPKSKHRSGR